jgi:SAM-dependent methyltransferase
MGMIPWWLKLSAKLVLARLPVSYGFWRSIGLFRHGEMNDPARAIRTFCSYYERAQKYAALPAGFESLELGPGDSILAGLAARAYGAKRAWLVDAGSFATTDIHVCKQVVELLRQNGANPANIDDARNLTEALEKSNVRYLTEGTKSLAHIPDASIDFFWSQVVLEHVPKEEFPRMLQELRRILKADGIGVHSIDFRDHLGGGLNNLRFSSRIWESHYFRNSGFYTNRIRPRDMLMMFSDAGFVVEVIKETRWPQLPLARNKMAREFYALPDDDFMVAEIEIIIRP